MATQIFVVAGRSFAEVSDYSQTMKEIHHKDQMDNKIQNYYSSFIGRWSGL